MKKIISLLLVLVMVFALAACGNSKNEPKEETLPENATMGQTLLFDFKQNVGTAASLEELANKLMENEVIEFGPMVMPMEEGYLAGFDTEIHGFTECVVFSPMIGSIPFMGYVMKAESEAAAQDLAKTLDEHANLRWNICTEADEKVVEAVGDTVFFVMCRNAEE